MVACPSIDPQIAGQVWGRQQNDEFLNISMDFSHFPPYLVNVCLGVANPYKTVDMNRVGGGAPAPHPELILDHIHSSDVLTCLLRHVQC